MMMIDDDASSELNCQMAMKAESPLSSPSSSHHSQDPQLQVHRYRKHHQVSNPHSDQMHSRQISAKWVSRSSGRLLNRCIRPDRSIRAAYNQPIVLPWVEYGRITRPFLSLLLSVVVFVFLFFVSVCVCESVCIPYSAPMFLSSLSVALSGWNCSLIASPLPLPALRLRPCLKKL